MAGQLAVASLNFLLLSTVAASLTPVEAADSARLAARDSNTCGDNSLTACDGGFPSNFCCGASTTCIALANASSVICCPAGQDCSFIAPITCDISQQDAVLHPANQIHTTNLTASLPRCSNACCPFGYYCRDGNCLIETQSEAPTVTSSPSPAASTTSHVAVTLSTPIVTATSAATALPSSTAARHAQISASAVLAGLFPGIVIGIIVCLLVLLLIRRRRRRRATDQENFGHRPTKRSVSDPMIHPSFPSHRTDFLMRQNTIDHPDFPTRGLLRTPPSRTPPVRSQETTPTPLPSSTYPWATYSPPQQLLPQTTFTPPQSGQRKEPMTPVRGMPRAVNTPSTVLTPVRSCRPYRRHNMGSSVRTPRPSRKVPIDRSIPTPPAAAAAVYQLRKEPTSRSRHASPRSSSNSSIKEYSSSETIEVLMPPPTAGLEPPPVLREMRERDRPDSARTAGTTFSGIMDKAGLTNYYAGHMPTRRGRA